MSNPIKSFIRFRTVRPPTRPPNGFVDLFWDRLTSTLKLVFSDGEQTIVGGSSTGSPIEGSNARWEEGDGSVVFVSGLTGDYAILNGPYSLNNPSASPDSYRVWIKGAGSDFCKIYNVSGYWYIANPSSGDSPIVQAVGGLGAWDHPWDVPSWKDSGTNAATSGLAIKGAAIPGLPIVTNPSELIASISSIIDLDLDDDYTLTAADNGKIYRLINSVPVVIGMPDDDPGGNFSVAFVRQGTGSVTFDGNGNDLLSYNDLTDIAGLHAWASVIRVGLNQYNLSGTLA
jgi:hypothetical protein